MIQITIIKNFSIMKLLSFTITLFTLAFIGCTNKDIDKHNEGASGIEPLAYTLYTENLELFVEFKPLIKGEISKFAAHFTILGSNFSPLNEAEITVSLLVGENGIRTTSSIASSPGIFRLALNPNYVGKGTLIFDIITKEFSDTITIDNITVYADTKSALENQSEETIGEEIVYLKEQAWKIKFANIEVKRQPFSEIIKTTGQIQPAQGDEVIITANSNGIISYGHNVKMIGSAIKSGEILLTISGSGLTEYNLDTKYKEAKAKYEKNKTDFERAKELAKDNIISQKDFQQIQLRYTNAQITFNAIANNYTTVGQNITSPIQGYIKNVLVSEGEYVEIGQAIASISQNQKLLLKAEVSQKHFSKLKSISSANFKTAYDDKVYSSDSLSGKLISYGKSTNDYAYYIPVHFEIDNKMGMIPGSFIEVFLKTNVIKDALVIPYASLIEEHGFYYAYVQTSGEGFQKRELNLGASDGLNVQVLSGVKENERVVTKGAYQIKLATMSGKMPAHGHEH
jgi:cobalt-zinc-cadmium efflux system membrane fusion protein